jgi:phosphoserine phosphatase
MVLRLAIFDLDGTLKQARDPYAFLHKRLGTWEASQSFFSRALAGELDYEEWLRLDARLWKGVSRRTLEDLFSQNPYLPGAQDVVCALKGMGVCVALVSTGLRLHAEQVHEDLGLDRIVANEICFQNGRVTGEARAHVPEGGKGQIVARLQGEFGVEPEECLAVGDGMSDVDMYKKVRLGVAVTPSSERVRSAADLILEEADLRPLLTMVREVLPAWLPA